MSLIIALFLIVIILCKAGGEKSKAAAFDRRAREQNRIVADWENLYVDKDLEIRLKRCIADEYNYAEVREEVSKVLSTMEHWRYLLDGDFALNKSQIYGAANYKRACERMRKNQTIALDIMLANRGKISTMAAIFGYEAYMDGPRELKESAYEYAETILKLMRQHGADVNLYYHSYLGSKAYYWEGTNPSHKNDPAKYEVKFAFDREIIFKRHPIP